MNTNSKNKLLNTGDDTFDIKLLMNRNKYGDIIKETTSFYKLDDSDLLSGDSDLCPSLLEETSCDRTENKQQLIYKNIRKEAQELVNDANFILNGETIFPKFYKRLLYQIKKLKRIHIKNKNLNHKELSKLLSEGYIRNNTEWPLLQDVLECYTIQFNKIICNNQALNIPNKYNSRNMYFNCSIELKDILDRKQITDTFTDENIYEIIKLAIGSITTDNISIFPLNHRKSLLDFNSFDISLSEHFDKQYTIALLDGLCFIVDKINSELFLIDPSQSLVKRKTQVVEILMFLCYDKSKHPSKKHYANTFKIYDVTNSFNGNIKSINTNILSNLITFIKNQNEVLSLWKLEENFTYKTQKDIKGSMKGYFEDSSKYKKVFQLCYLDFGGLRDCLRTLFFKHLL
ncbi:hypothetical protein QEN19_003007 [Hanseniaspora menglaensis]